MMKAFKIFCIFLILLNLYIGLHGEITPLNLIAAICLSISLTLYTEDIKQILISDDNYRIKIACTESYFNVYERFLKNKKRGEIKMEDYIAELECKIEILEDHVNILENLLDAHQKYNKFLLDTNEELNNKLAVYINHIQRSKEKDGEQ